MDYQIVNPDGSAYDDSMQFPHCDPRVLHAPTECEFCDRHPDWQYLRQMWGINFTGHHETKSSEYSDAPMLPCPSEAARPLSDINQWDGNVPHKDGKVNKEAPMFEGKAVLHDAWSRHVEVTIADPNCSLCHGEGEVDSGGVSPWDQPIYVRCECTYPPGDPRSGR